MFVSDLESRTQSVASASSVADHGLKSEGGASSLYMELLTYLYGARQEVDMYKQRGALYALYVALALFACEDEPSKTQGGGVAGATTAGDAINAGQRGGAEAGAATGGASTGGGSAGHTAGVTGGQTWLPPADMGPSGGGGAQGGEGGEPALTLDMSPASLSLSIDSPVEGAVFPTADDITVSGAVTLEGLSLEFVAIEATLDDALSVPVLLDRESGAIELVISEPSVGEHTLSVHAAVAPDLRAEQRLTFTVSCEMVNEFNEPLDPTMWVARGPAIRDERGWLELTQNQLHTQGALFWAGSPVQPGDLDLEFSFSTSKCDEPGPCDLNRINAGGGFSINFWDVRPQNLEALWEVTTGLGNVTPQPLLDERGMPRVDSFHIVFDTYSNTCTPCSRPSDYDGCGNRHEEPTVENHVSLIFNGHRAIHGEPDGEGSYCHLGPVGEEFSERWTAFPDLDDGRWHHARLTIEGTRIQLWINEQPLIDFELPTLSFKGGVLSIAAGSGVNGNFHRVDRLRINNSCR